MKNRLARQDGFSGGGRWISPDGDKLRLHLPCKEKYRPSKRTIGIFGGGRWIRTIEGIASRFTVCPLWPLGNSPICNLSEGGAGRRTRTPDLLITNQLLYQLSYTSTISSEVYVTRNVPICQPLNLFFWRFFILRIVRKRWRDLQRAWPAGLCPRCGMELYPGDLDWVLGGRRLCGACAAAWLAEEAERLAAGRKGAVE